MNGKLKLKPKIKSNSTTSNIVSLKELNSLLQNMKKDSRAQLIQSTVRKERL